jgi:hypothetical protein
VVFGPRRSRIQQAIVEIGDASSGFLQFVAMAFGGDQRDQPVQIRSIVGSAYRPIAMC